MEHWETDYWQAYQPAVAKVQTAFRDAYPARMPDGRRLLLPLRDLEDVAVAGLIANQASFAVFDALAGWLTQVARRHAPDIVVGLPTLGHAFGAAVARGLGHANWVAPGTSRKLWYEEALSVGLASITSPVAGRRMWLDPRVAHRLAERRVLVIDDVVSTGASLGAAVALLAAAGVRPVACCAAMLQGDRWRAAVPDMPVEGVFATPLFRRAGEGWAEVAGSAPVECCPLL